MTAADVFQISILSEKKMYPTSTLMTTSQLQQGDHAPVHLSQHELREDIMFCQVIDEDWSKTEHSTLWPCPSEEDKAAVLPPPRSSASARQ